MIPHPSIPKVLKVQVKKIEANFSVSFLLVIPNNERKIIVHEQVNHNIGICTKTAVSTDIWRPNEVDDPHFLFRFLMSYDHHYTTSKK